MQQSLNESSGEMERGPAKRQAKKGQWATPPVGELFPAATPAPDGSGINLRTGCFPVPNTSDDYAKALQEAYRRGAEAAAAMSQTATNGLNTTGAPLNTSTIRTGTSAPPIQQQQQLQQQQLQLQEQQQQVSMDPSSTLTVNSGAVSTNMGVPTPLPFPSSLAEPSSVQTPAQPPEAEEAQQATSHATLPQQSFYMNVDPTPVIPEVVSSATAGGISASMSSMAANRSVSMPDMSSLDNADDEEAKRLKRLARNRASARLRRLRKKNLVSTIVYITYTVLTD